MIELYLTGITLTFKDKDKLSLRPNRDLVLGYRQLLLNAINEEKFYLQDKLLFKKTPYLKHWHKLIAIEAKKATQTTQT